MSMTLHQNVSDFTAAMTSEKTFTFSNYLGKYVVIYFYPKDNTPGCTTESGEFRDLYPQFQNLNIEIFGLSRDNLRSHTTFKEKLALPFELISDPDETICSLFSVMKNKNMYGKQVRGIERSTFVIDDKGVLVKEWRGVKANGHAEEVLEYMHTMLR